MDQSTWFASAALRCDGFRKRLEIAVPRYSELAAPFGDVVESVESLVLCPSGPLHREPDRRLLEEMLPASEVRPVFDAIGAGARRLSETERGSAVRPRRRSPAKL